MANLLTSIINGKIIIIFAQIENISSINNLGTIFGSKKIDAYFIGPYDLSASMNIPGDFNNKKFINVII